MHRKTLLSIALILAATTARAEIDTSALVSQLQSPQKPPHARAGRHAFAVHALCAQFVGRLYLAQSANFGRSDGVFDGPCAQLIKADGLMDVVLTQFAL